MLAARERHLRASITMLCAPSYLALKPLCGLLGEAEESWRLWAQWSGVIAADEPYTQRVFQAAPELQLIARDGAGFDSIDLQAATRHGVIANNAPVVHEAAADLTWRLILATVRRIVVADRGVREGQWADRDAYLSSGVHGKTLGIVGLGWVGRAVARRGSGFDMNVIAYDVADLAVAGELKGRLAS